MKLNKNILLTIIIVLSFLPAWSSGQIINEKPEPEKQPYPFEDNILLFERADSINPPPQNAILFIGSSSIRMWQTLKKDMAPLKVINRGFGGSHAEHVLHFMNRIVFPYHPRAIVFYEGDNDIFAGKSPERVLYDYQAFADSVHINLPETRLFILSLKPSYNRIKIWPEMEKTNILLKKFCAQYEFLEYIDISRTMFDDQGFLRKDIFLDDQLHMNAKGYALWTEVIRKRLLTWINH